MLNKKIVLDPDVARVSDQAALLFSWLIPFADRDGRLFGDPHVVKGQVMTRRPTYTVETIRECLKELAEHGLIEWYEDDNDMYISLPGFRHNQEGLRYDREAESQYPAPPSAEGSTTRPVFCGPTPERLRSDSGATPQNGGAAPLQVEVEAEREREEEEEEARVRDENLTPLQRCRQSYATHLARTNFTLEERIQVEQALERGVTPELVDHIFATSRDKTVPHKWAFSCIANAAASGVTTVEQWEAMHTSARASPRDTSLERQIFESKLAKKRALS